MGEAAAELPRIDFTGVDASAPGTGRWDAVRAQVTDALATFGCFDTYYPALTPARRAALFDGAVRPLFALPIDAKRRNTYGPEKPLHGYLGELPGYHAYDYESLAIVDGHRPDAVQAFGELMFPGADNAALCETIHGVAARMAELEGAVRRMVMEGLGVRDDEARNDPVWHLFRMSEYGAPTAGEKQREVRFGSHQDTNSLSVVCQHEVEGLEMQARDGRWVLVRPSPASLVVMAGNALRAWSNDRVHAPFHRVSVGGDVTRYSAVLFSVPGDGSVVRVADELVDEAGGRPRRFRDYDYDEFIRFCVSEEGGRHEDKLKAYCGL